MKRVVGGDSGEGRKIYYAHAVCIYGSDEEKTQKKSIRKIFPSAVIVNPASYRRKYSEWLCEDDRQDRMEFFYNMIDKCDKLVFCRLLGVITAGVGKEINYAIANGKPVFELSGSTSRRMRTKKVKFASPEETVKLYGYWRRANKTSD
ncbi:MAG: hypothetical protein KIS30_04125 [Thermoplasmata archaeon]|nr:hypothetical protein [Candidatus Sysuiplasma acidicola]MBX8645932.1 hypothetical protein [Candidatus Sysuiplasma acidicola]